VAHDQHCLRLSTVKLIRGLKRELSLSKRFPMNQPDTGFLRFTSQSWKDPGRRNVPGKFIAETFRYPWNLKREGHLASRNLRAEPFPLSRSSSTTTTPISARWGTFSAETGGQNRAISMLFSSAYFFIFRAASPFDVAVIRKHLFGGSKTELPRRAAEAPIGTFGELSCGHGKLSLRHRHQSSLRIHIKASTQGSVANETKKSSAWAWKKKPALCAAFAQTIPLNILQELLGGRIRRRAPSLHEADRHRFCGSQPFPTINKLFRIDSRSMDAVYLRLKFFSSRPLAAHQCLLASIYEA